MFLKQKNPTLTQGNLFAQPQFTPLASKRGVFMPQKEFIELLRKDPHEFENEEITNKIKAFLASHEDASARATALAIFKVFENIYPLRNNQQFKRLDGTYTRYHPLTIAYKCMEAGADIDAVLAALLHDTKEDGLIPTKNDFYQMIRKAGLRDGIHTNLVDTVWEIVEIISNDIIPGSTFYMHKQELEGLLKTPQDLDNPRIDELVDIVYKNGYYEYVSNIYRSRSFTAMQIKELDTLHNIQTLQRLDPINDFAKIYKAMLKALTHIDYAKKAAYPISSSVLLALTQLWEKLEAAFVENNLQFSKELLQVRGNIRRHRYSKSPYQEEIEAIGVAPDAPPRKRFTPEKSYSYDRSGIPTVSIPELEHIFKAVKIDGQEPKYRWEVEFHLEYCENIGGDRIDFLNPAFKKKTEQDLLQTIEYFYRRKGINYQKTESYMFPSISSGKAIILDLEPPQKIVRNIEFMIKYGPGRTGSPERRDYDRKEDEVRLAYKKFRKDVVMATQKVSKSVYISGQNPLEKAWIRLWNRMKARSDYHNIIRTL